MRKLPAILAVAAAVILAACTLDTATGPATVQSPNNPLAKKEAGENGKVRVCHFSGKNNSKANILDVSASALSAHLGHGDIQAQDYMVTDDDCFLPPPPPPPPPEDHCFGWDGVNCPA